MEPQESRGLATQCQARVNFAGAGVFAQDTVTLVR